MCYLKWSYTITYTKELLEDAVLNSVSFAGVLRYLGVKQAGGTHCHIKNKVVSYGIDYSHFTGQHWAKGTHSTKKIHYSDILVLNTGLTKEKTYKLRRAMLEAGIEYLCSECGISEWNNKYIILQIHHIDGDNMNNVRDNVCFLCPNCPNCHSQTDGYSKRKG